ncbi:MAG: hypothetical protein PHD32_11165 [Eubacteriales bacterium]|nr:hypothetical protein [Eubacteriales bacterium]
MQIIIPLENQVRTIIRSGYIMAKRVSVDAYQLSGDTFNMCDVTAAQVLLLPDDVSVSEGEALTNELQMQALPMETFLAPSAEESLSETLGLLLRSAVADGKITDAELLRVAPSLEGRQWQSGIPVTVGDVYAFGAFLWKCVQAHTTQGDWSPDLTPALWHKVEIVKEDEQRVWSTGIEYAVGDVVAYPDASSAKYECLQAHTAQEGWQPPNVPALWKALV